MISLVPTNNARALEVRKFEWGRIIELKAIFGNGLETKVRIPLKDLQTCLLLHSGDFKDFEGGLQRAHRLNRTEMRLFFVPNDHCDLVVVKIADLSASLNPN